MNEDEGSKNTFRPETSNHSSHISKDEAKFSMKQAFKESMNNTNLECKTYQERICYRPTYLID